MSQFLMHGRGKLNPRQRQIDTSSKQHGKENEQAAHFQSECSGAPC